MSLQGDVDKLIRQLRAYGWHVDTTSRGHWKLTSPAGQVVIASGTPSDHRALKNLMAQLKRAGYAPRRGRPPKLAKPVPSSVPAEPAAPSGLEDQPTPEQGTPTQLSHDIAVLDRALGTLADVEDIIKRYRDALVTLKGLL